MKPADSYSTERHELPQPGIGAVVVRVLGEDAGDEALWQAYARRSPLATIYHDLAWRGIFGSALGYRAFPLVAVDAVTGACRGLLPLFLVPSPIGRPRLVAVPFRDRGGLLYDDDVAFRSLIAKACALRLEMRACTVQLKTIVPYPEALCADAGLARTDYWVHSVASLAGMRETGLLKALGDKTRNMIRQAERVALRTVEVPYSSDALRSWYGLHQRSQQALGLPPFPRALFARTLETLASRGLARLFLVKDADGCAVAGSIILMDRSAAIYAYSASAPSERRLRPNDLMLFRIMCGLIEEGIERFDFGSDSPEQMGLLFFKRKWLARQAVIPQYFLGRRKSEFVDSSNSRYNVARAITRHVPLPLARVTLAPLVRFFG